MHTTRRRCALSATLSLLLSLTACSKERDPESVANQPEDASPKQSTEAPAVTPSDEPKETPEEAGGALAAKVTLEAGRTAKYRLADGSLAEAALIERWVDDATKVTHLALGGVVVATERERDSPVVHVFSAPGKPSVVAIETIGGGPGTCVWTKEVRAFSAGDLTAFANDEAAPTGTPIALGAYLECRDGTKRSCGCGTWEATWSAEFRDGDVLEFTTEPKTSYRSEDKAPVDPPRGLTIAVPVR